MDHLQLALDGPPAATFRPVLRALRLHAVEASSRGPPSTARISRWQPRDDRAKAERHQKAGLLENPLGRAIRRGR
jgi:hypothetical protein